MLGGAEIIALALTCAPQVESGTAQAIVRRESSGNPFAINPYPGGRLSHQPTTKEHALHVAGVLQRAGVEFDVGLAQIRTSNIRRLGLTVDQVLDPCTNLQVMQRILLENYQRAVAQGKPAGAQASLASISAYNTGNFVKGFANGYVAKVVAAHPENRNGTK